MTRILLLLAALMVLMPGAALAQGTPPPGVCDPEPSVDDVAEYPPGRGVVAVGATVVTPGAVIAIDGDDWSCETIVEITAVTDDGRRTSLGTAPVRADGTFSVDLVVPEDAVDTVTIEVRGVDRKGEQRTDAVELKVQSAGAVSTFALGETPEPADDSSLFVWLGVVTIAAALAVGGGSWVAARRRVSPPAR